MTDDANAAIDALPPCYRCHDQPCVCKDGCTILHGDCREILPLFALGSFDLMLTDPPYGINLREHGRNGYDWTITGDSDQSLGNAVLELCESVPTMTFANPKRPWSGKWRQHLVWDKGPTVGGGGDKDTCWKFSWDLIQTRGIRLRGARGEAVLRFHVTQRDYALHPNQKPLTLLRYLIAKTTDCQNAIIDPFCGSGSTVVAAKQFHRRAVGIEIEEKYCEIAARRLEQSVFAFPKEPAVAERQEKLFVEAADA